MPDHGVETLAALADVIASRRTADPGLSYTARLLSQGAAKCAKKFGEEAVEAALAGALKDRSQLAGEAADVLYHLLVLLEAADVKLSDVMQELARRQGIGGLVEKAGRPGD